MRSSRSEIHCHTGEVVVIRHERPFGSSRSAMVCSGSIVWAGIGRDLRRVASEFVRFEVVSQAPSEVEALQR